MRHNRSKPQRVCGHRISRRSSRTRTGGDETKNEALCSGAEELVRIMGKISDLVAKHLEWRQQPGPERMDNLFRELMQL
jgi:hypothetical protein